MMHSVLVEYLINAAWQVPLVMLGALAVSRWGGLAPAARNLAWLGFLAMAVVSPALPIDFPKPAPVAGQMARTVDLASLPALSPVAANLDRANPSRLIRVALDARSADLIRLAFAAVVAVALARLAVAAVAAHRLVRRARETALDEPVAKALERFAAEHGRRTPGVLTSDAVRSPAVVGVVRPVILTPVRFAHLSAEDQTAALLHECAHVLRRDYAVNLLSEAFALPLSWHPALYQIKSGVRRSRELACDAMAATAMASHEAYARSLLSLAKALGGRPEPANSVVVAAAYVGLFGKSDLEDRLMHLLSPKDGAGEGRKVARLGAAATLAALALAPTMLVRVTPGLAQTTPAAPRAVQPVSVAQASTTSTSLAPGAVASNPMLVHVATPTEPPAPPAAAAPAEPPRQAAKHCPTAERAARIARQDAHVGDVDAADSDEDRFAGVIVGPDGHSVGLSEKDRARLRAQQRGMEANIRQAAERVVATQQRLNASALRQKMAEIASIDREKFSRQAQAAAAKAMSDERVQESLARAQERIAAEAEQESRDLETASRTDADRIQRDVERSMRGMTLGAADR